jgi:hypothetical protein
VVGFTSLLSSAPIAKTYEWKKGFICRSKTTRGGGSGIDCSFPNNRLSQKEEAKGEARQKDKRLRNLEALRGFCKRNTAA